MTPSTIPTTAETTSEGDSNTFETFSMFTRRSSRCATGNDQARLKLHLTELLSIGLPPRVQTTDVTTHERSQLLIGEWVADTLILFDLSFYDFWLFDRVDAFDGWSVSRVKSNADPEIIEEFWTWRGNSIALEGIAESRQGRTSATGSRRSR